MDLSQGVQFLLQEHAHIAPQPDAQLAEHQASMNRHTHKHPLTHTNNNPHPANTQIGMNTYTLKEPRSRGKLCNPQIAMNNTLSIFCEAKQTDRPTLHGPPGTMIKETTTQCHCALKKNMERTSQPSDGFYTHTHTHSSLSTTNKQQLTLCTHNHAIHTTVEHTKCKYQHMNCTLLWFDVSQYQTDSLFNLCFNLCECLLALFSRA